MCFRTSVRLCLPPPQFRIVATDFDAYFIKKAKEFFTNITSMKFDFFNDNLIDFYKNIKTDFDLGISFESFYVMDTDQYINFLNKCYSVDLKRIIYFSSSTINLKKMIKVTIRNTLIKNKIIRKIFGKDPVIDSYKGKFHGYARDKRELKKIYNAGGYRIMKTYSLPRSYNNVFILAKI